MGREASRSRMNIAGDIVWGAQSWQFYEAKDDLLHVPLTQLRAPSEDSRFRIWTAGESLNERELREALGKAVANFDRCLNRWQIGILPHEKRHLREGIPHSDTALKSRAQGPTERRSRAMMVCLTGHTIWLEERDPRVFADYDAAMRNTVGNYLMNAVCPYCSIECEASHTVDVVVNHQFPTVSREAEGKTPSEATSASSHTDTLTRSLGKIVSQR